jgi:hypothetical protein
MSGFWRLPLTDQQVPYIGVSASVQLTGASIETRTRPYHP